MKHQERQPATTAAPEKLLKEIERLNSMVKIYAVDLAVLEQKLRIAERALEGLSDVGILKARRALAKIREG